MRPYIKSTNALDNRSFARKIGDCVNGWDVARQRNFLRRRGPLRRNDRNCGYGHVRGFTAEGGRWCGCARECRETKIPAKIRKNYKRDDPSLVAADVCVATLPGEMWFLHVNLSFCFRLHWHHPSNPIFASPMVEYWSPAGRWRSHAECCIPSERRTAWATVANSNPPITGAAKRGILPPHRLPSPAPWASCL